MLIVALLVILFHLYVSKLKSSSTPNKPISNYALDHVLTMNSEHQMSELSSHVDIDCGGSSGGAD